MYIYNSAIARLKGISDRWLDVDLQNVALNEIYETYRSVWLILGNTSFADPEVLVSLDLNKIRLENIFNIQTVEEFLQGLGNQSLPTQPGVIEINTRTIGYSSAWKANYDCIPTKMGAHPDADFPESEKEDLLIKRDDIDYQFMYDHSLVSINGMIHQTSFSEHGLYVVDGAKSWRIANDNHVGIISFEKISPLTFIQLTPDMVYNSHEGKLLKNGIYVKLNHDITNKTVIMVLGGYLHVLDNAYKQVGDDIFKIDILNFPLPKRIFESSKLIDMSSLDLESTDRNETQVSVENLFSNEVLTNYMLLSQTFFVVVDTDNLYVVKHRLENSLLGSKYYSNVEPKFPLRRKDGNWLDYHSNYDQYKWVVSVDNSRANNYNYKTTNWRNENSIDATRYSYRPYSEVGAELVEIGIDL